MKTLPTKFSNFIICLSFFLCATATFAQWQILGEQKFSDVALGGLDFTISEGTPYIVCSASLDDNNVKVMKYDGAEWVYLGFESFPIGKVHYPSIAVHDNIIYISYRDTDFENKTSVIKYDGNSWTYVGQRGFSTGEARFQSIALHDGEPYVAFEDETYSYESSVMKYDGDNWVYIGDPGATSGISAGQSIYNKIVFEQGELYMVFITPMIMGQNETRVMKYDGNIWAQVGDIGFSNTDGTRQSLGFHNGEPYCTFLQSGIYKASVKKYNGSEWTDVGMPGFSSYLAAKIQIIVHKGVPYVSYRDFTDPHKLTVMYFDGNDWLPLGGVGVSPEGAERPVIAAHENTIYVAFLDAENPNPGKVTVMYYDLLTNVDREPEVSISFDLHPNPASDYLTITTQEEIESISILSLEGRLIEKHQTKNIDLTRIPNGLYLVQVKTDKGVGYKRFVKD